MFHGNVSLEIAEGLKLLRRRIEAAKIPPSKLDETLNIATWNVRELGKKRRSEAAIHYIAEIIGQFDLVGLVELRDNLQDLQRILPILGPYWDAVYSDAIPDAGGNRERICYLYDQRACVFNGMAAEASPPRKKKGTEYISAESWWRAPYVASFKAGNFDFLAFTVHVRWGNDEASREREIQGLANWLEAKINDKNGEDRDVIAMGDFNIPSRSSPMFKALTSKGLVLPRALIKDEFGSNLARDKRYDQILHFARYGEDFTLAGGVLDFYAGDHKPLFPELTKEEFTYQMSDHLPLWIQINTDIDGVVLDQIIQRKR
ncbi:MAG: endonuclease/exonuclease/phosphatase family protein [Pseudomonadota bacterium]|nr:endonuclease/exonuclease/phosphatase family protein [Pseudomonadota bacterium]